MLVDKPEGPTSHDVVARARRLFHTRAVGHTGTLDPFATGLLVLVFGGATRLARWAERHQKVYRAVIRLGISTDTDDRTGAVVGQQTPPEWPSQDAVLEALGRLTGPQWQRPPTYSAKRVDGERSHRLARRGARPEPAPALVTVYGIELLEYAPPLVTIRADVGPGTYIRALGRDLGAILETGAHVTELRRERVGDWRVEDATPLGELTGAEPLLAPRALVADLPGIQLTPAEVAAVAHGRDVVRPGPTEGEAALLAGNRLIAVASGAPGGWHPRVVLSGGQGASE
jgi:tRNA pseudouridine55 synthase